MEEFFAHFFGGLIDEHSDFNRVILFPIQAKVAPLVARSARLTPVPPSRAHSEISTQLLFTLCQRFIGRAVQRMHQESICSAHVHV